MGHGVELEQISAVARAALSRNLTYLSQKRLLKIERSLEQLDRDGIKGDFCEFGVALGGSAIVIASRLAPTRSFHGFDVFEMIPPPGDKDDHLSKARYATIASGQSPGIGGEVYYGYREDLYKQVVRNIVSFGLKVDGNKICLHRGKFENTFDEFLPLSLAFAHIDCDWYESVKFCLERTHQKLSSGGIIIVDDYNDWVGCRRATDEFLARHRNATLLEDRCSAIIRHN